LENVMPVYGNTHTTTSFCASQISAYRYLLYLLLGSMHAFKLLNYSFREESRQVVKKYCGGGPEDEVIFCGSGATAAVHKLVHSISKPGDQPPIVILGPYEHHSNVLPWREITKDVFTVAIDSRGYVDMKDLKHILESVHKRAKSEGRRIIGSFSAGSNVTGSLTDDVAVTNLLHKYGGFSFWDFAAAAPHVQIRMNPGDEKNASKDAIFFSGHKFLGGPQTPGVLVVKKHVLRNPVPHGHGGGTVQFVTRDNHQYVKV
jgi:selenocysteine lyase/cysteine desulfurase